jgi:hypothetical protein
MDDPWADSPPTPRTGTPRVSLDGLSSGLQASPLKVGLASPTKSESETETGTETEAEPAIVPSEVLAPPIQEDLNGGEDGGVGDDDFDDFDAPEAGPSTGFPAPSGGEGDDGFGDFGDFEEGNFGEEQGEMPSTTVEQTIEPEVQPERWVSPFNLLAGTARERVHGFTQLDHCKGSHVILVMNHEWRWEGGKERAMRRKLISPGSTQPPPVPYPLRAR